MDIVSQSVQSLQDGVDGKVVAETLRHHFGTVRCLNAKLSKVRKGYLAQASHPAEYANASKALREASRVLKDPSPVRDFLSKPLKDQYAIQKAHRKGARLTKDEHINALVTTLPLVPDSFKNFRVTPEEELECKQAAETQREEKNAALRTHSNPEEMLHAMRQEITNASPASHIYALGAALLGVSGRRCVEIFNCRSTFDPVDGAPYVTMFTGQAKKRDKPMEAYAIPLLVPYTDFHRAFRLFCDLQRAHAERTGKRAPCDRSNEEIEGQNRSLRTWLTRCDKQGRRMRPEYRDMDIVKNFREVYLQYVKHLFHLPPWSDNMLSKKIHGHDGLETSLAYVNTQQHWRTPPKRIGSFGGATGASEGASEVSEGASGGASEGASEAAEAAVATTAASALAETPRVASVALPPGKMRLKGYVDLVVG